VRFLGVDEKSHELRRQWAAGRVWAAHEAPYLATALLALQAVVIEREPGDRAIDLRAFPADGDWHVYVDPEVLAETPVGELGFWLLHQVTHLLREHAARYPGKPLPASPGSASLGTRTKDQNRWNVAGDAEINDDLHTARLELPDRAIHPETLDLPEGLTAEQYWDALAPDDDEGIDFAGRTDEAFGLAARGEAGVESTLASACDCGSGCDGQPRVWDCDRPGLSPVDVRMVARNTARQIREHTQQRGDTPEGWQRWADDMLEPSVNWRRQLAAHVRRGAADVAGRVDFTYRRPSRRASAIPDVVMPSLRQPLPQVALVIDTSGSMSDTMLGQALGEVAGVLRSLGVARRNLRVIACDARAYRAQQVRDLGAIRLEGGGGTDMGAGLDAAAALRPRPDLIIVLTDGHTPWRSAPPGGIRVVVGLMDRGGRTPDWAETVLVGDLAGAAR
jgi:predicted metal-dependent peptidase